METSDRKRFWLICTLYEFHLTFLQKSFLVDLDAFMISRNDEMRDPDGSISLLLNGEQGVIELTRKWTESSPIGYDTIEGAEAYIVDCPDFHPVSFSALASQLEDASYIREVRML